MKTILNKAFILFAVLLAMVACKSDDMNYVEATVTPVSELFAPVNGQNVKLSSTDGAAILFQWATALTQDGQVVSSEVLFYKESDKVNPVYTVISYNNGASNYISIPHRDLNKACAAAGIATGEVGTIYWSVASSRGLNTATCTKQFALTLKRLNGFTDIPENVVITGSASEGGTDIAKAIKMRETVDGEFEVYTQLDKAGSYTFVGQLLNGDKKVYYIDPTKELKFAEGDNASTVAEKGIYKINIDYNTGTTSISQITKVEFYMCTPNKSETLDYQGYGIWSKKNVAVDMTTGWSDDRYFFKMYIKGQPESIKMGSPNKDNQPTSATSGEYFELVPRIDASQWDYSYKIKNRNPNTVVDFTLYFTADGPYYYHAINYVSN